MWKKEPESSVVRQDPADVGTPVVLAQLGVYDAGQRRYRRK
jgi:hypothetical protein